MLGGLLARCPRAGAAPRRQFSRLQLSRRLPQPLKIVISSRVFREYVHYEIHIIEQHPLRLLVTFNVSGAHSLCVESLRHFIADRLHLPRIASAANHRIIRECSRIFLELKNSDFFRLFFLAGLNGFSDLAFQVVFLHSVDCYRGTQGGPQLLYPILMSSGFSGVSAARHPTHPRAGFTSVRRKSPPLNSSASPLDLASA